jgi:hypothetical protein
MSLNKLKNGVLGCVVLATAISGTMEFASAGILKPSGRLTNNSNIDFEINTDITDSDSSSDKGSFQNAILKYTNSADENFNLSGNITVSKLTSDSDGKVSNLFDNDNQQFTLDSLKSLVGSNIDFSGDVIRYDVEIPKSKSPKLIWFVNSTDTSLINDLSGLSKFRNLYGFSLSDVSITGNNGGTFEFLIPETSKIPESNNILGVIAISAVVTTLRLTKFKRIKAN